MYRVNGKYNTTMLNNNIIKSSAYVNYMMKLYNELINRTKGSNIYENHYDIKITKRGRSLTIIAKYVSKQGLGLINISYKRLINCRNGR